MMAWRFMAVIVNSSYLPEVMNLSERILVCRQGRIIEEFVPEKPPRNYHVRGQCTESLSVARRASLGERQVTARETRRWLSSMKLDRRLSTWLPVNDCQRERAKWGPIDTS